MTTTTCWPNDVVVCEIFLSLAAPEHALDWTSNEHQGRPPAFGSEARLGALRALGLVWLRQCQAAEAGLRCGQPSGQLNALPARPGI
jgi:hypothetical protein